jgi:hypothetical protein
MKNKKRGPVDKLPDKMALPNQSSKIVSCTLRKRTTSERTCHIICPGMQHSATHHNIHFARRIIKHVLFLLDLVVFDYNLSLKICKFGLIYYQ